MLVVELGLRSDGVVFMVELTILVVWPHFFSETGDGCWYLTRLAFGNGGSSSFSKCGVDDVGVAEEDRNIVDDDLARVILRIVTDELGTG